MSKKRPRMQTQGREPLLDNPFASLAGASLPVAAPPAASDDSAPAREDAPSTYRVCRTRKGGWPVRIERRAGNRKVTVIEAVDGDAKHLLRALQRHCGAGGSCAEDMIVLQGDQREAIISFLDKVFAKS